MTRISLKKNEDRRIKAGHPWVFSNEIGLRKPDPRAFAARIRNEAHALLVALARRRRGVLRQREDEAGQAREELREAAQAQIRVIVRRILRKYGYPPDKQEKATQTVLEQAEVLSEIWAAGNPPA